MSLARGSKLGTYEVISPLGAGGMGEVYRARDTRLGREVAIKVLPADWLHDEHRRHRFVQEAQSASALNHPHIITIYEIESDDDLDFIVMEYVRGQSLDALIPRHGLRLSELLRGESPLLALPLAGGPVRQLLPCVSAVNFAVGPTGIYYAACGAGISRSIRLLDRAGRDRVLGSISDIWPFALNRLAVAPDGKTILIQQQSISNDLMLIENFR